MEVESNMPEGWIETTLGETIYFVSDKINTEELTINNYISTENLLSDNQGIVASSNLPTVSKVNSFKKEDVLFSNIRTYFKKVWFASKDGGSSNDVLIFRPVNEDSLNKHFLYRIISSDVFIDYTVKTAKGTKMPRGDKNAIKLFPINLPPLTEQKAIAKVVTAFDEKIELLQAQNKTLETMAQTIFKEWFGKYQIGDELPEGWSTKTLNTLCSKITDGTHSTVIDDESGHYYLLSCKNIKNGKINIGNNERKINKTTLAFLRKRTGLRKDDIVLTTVGTIGEIAMVEDEVVNFEFQRSVAIIRCNKEKILPILMCLYAKSRFFQHQALSRCLGSVQTCLFLGEIKEIEINLPSITLQKVIANNLWPLMDKQRFNNDQIQSLTKTRDTLLPKLMSGQVRINHQKLQIS